MSEKVLRSIKSRTGYYDPQFECYWLSNRANHSVPVLLLANGRSSWSGLSSESLPGSHLERLRPLKMPVLTIGGEKSFGSTMAKVMRFAATNVQETVIPSSGHWLMEENPAATIKVLQAFL
jgi:pimeloyl-ACP methyl ester carboxylesterase